jgi:hypothetical protein
MESKSAQGQKPAQEASQRRRKRLRHDLARGFYDCSRAVCGTVWQAKAHALLIRNRKAALDMQAKDQELRA